MSDTMSHAEWQERMQEDRKEERSERSAGDEEMLAEALREIAEMGEDDVDAYLQDELRHPSGPGLSEPLRAACFRRLAELGKAPD